MHQEIIIEIYEKIFKIIDGKDMAVIMSAITLVLTDVILKNRNDKCDINLCIDDIIDVLKRNITYGCNLYLEKKD